MFGNVIALEGLHVPGKYRDKSMQHTCSRHAAWDPHTCRPWSCIRNLRHVPLSPSLAACLQLTPESTRESRRGSGGGAVDARNRDAHLVPGSQFKNNYFAEMCGGSEEGSYLRRIDFCITQV